MQNYQIKPISEQYIESFREAVGSVARERKYLAFLDAPTLEMTRTFVLENLRDGWPHVVAVIEDRVSWCDITSLHLLSLLIQVRQIKEWDQVIYRQLIVRK